MGESKRIAGDKINHADSIRGSLRLARVNFPDKTTVDSLWFSQKNGELELNVLSLIHLVLPIDLSVH